MLNPERHWLASTNFLNWSKVILPMCSEATSKLCLTVVNFFEIIRPICWIAETFQSKVLALFRPPPSDLVKVPADFRVLWPEAALYGFSLLSSR